MAIDRTALKKSQEFSHILARIPQNEPTVILDVGANVGDNADASARLWPIEQEIAGAGETKRA